MAITRTAMIDDDGSGTTGTIFNNAWKQELYNQIDGILIYGTFTPFDGTGAGLVFQAGTKGLYAKHDKIVHVWLQVVYPATSNGLNAVIGGLPFIVKSPVGVAQGYGISQAWWMSEDAFKLEPYNPATFAPKTNAQLSGMNLIMSATYLTAS